MTHRTPPKHRRRRDRPWPAVAVVLAVIAAGLITMGLRGHQVPLAGPATAPTPVTLAGPTTGPDLARPAGVPAPPVAVADPAASGLQSPQAGPAFSAPVAAVARSAPVALRIPALDLAVSLTTLGLNPDHTVEVPTDFGRPGWFRLGPAPGEVGSAVILGHVDSYQGPAVFFRLRDLNPGDQVEVSLADRVTAHFTVTSVVMYPKDQFPAQQVYAPHGHSDLQLVTCGGTFDTTTRSYLSNIVAYTTLTSITTTP